MRFAFVACGLIENLEKFSTEFNRTGYGFSFANGEPKSIFIDRLTHVQLIESVCHFATFEID